MSAWRPWVIGALLLSACAPVTPLLHPPDGRSRHDISRDMGECDQAAAPGMRTYAKAAGVGFVTRLLAPFAGLGAGAGVVAAQKPTPATADETRARLTTAAVFGGVGTAVGIVAGPFVATHAAGKAVQDETQRLFERCLQERGYRAPPPSIKAPHVLVLVEHNRTPAPAVEAFRSELERRGYVFGTTLHVDAQWWDGPRANAGVFVRSWDIVVAPSAEVALATQRTLPRVPIVVAGSEVDLVDAGLADSLTEPRRNVSGLALAPAEMNERRLQLLLEAVPHVRRVAVLANPDNPGHPAALEALAAAAPRLTLERVDVRADTDLDATFARIARDGAEAVIVLPDRVLRQRRDAVAVFARRERLPAIAGDVGFADVGGVLEYHPAVAETWREAAGFVDRILKGAPVGSLPIRTVAERDVVVNLTTADELGLTLSGRLTPSPTRVVR